MRGLLLLAVMSGILAGCGPDASYTLSWFVAGETRSDAYGCSSHGIDAIMVQAVHTSSGEPADVAIFPCAPHYATRKIHSGTYLLYVAPLNARGQRLVDPRTGVAREPLEVPVTIPEDGSLVVGPVTIEPNPACSDGVDNDGDGLVDLADPDCQDALGASEAPSD